MKLFAIFMLLPILSIAATDLVVEESIYQNYREQISKKRGLIKHLKGLNPFHDALFVDALDDALEEKDENALSTLKSINTIFYPLTEKVRVEILKIEHNLKSSIDSKILGQLINALKSPEAEFKLLSLVAENEDLLISKKYFEVVELAKKHSEFPVMAHKFLDDTVVADIYHKAPETAGRVKIFTFCPKSRLYPCLMVMKDINNKPVRRHSGKLWTHKSLSLSKVGLPYYARKGNTPSGVLTVDGVMPEVTRSHFFGKARRMVLNFVPKSSNEASLKAFLPSSSHHKSWWRESVSARDIGRTVLRIHGTGIHNEDPTSTFYPFIRTSGCIAQRENTYDGVTYRDTQVLLNAILSGMGLSPEYANEPKAKAVLYLVDIEDHDRAVELEDLKRWSIE